MLNSYIGYEIMLHENKLFTAHLQVLLPYIRVPAIPISRNRPWNRPTASASRPSIRTYHVHSVHDFPDFYNAIPWISLRWVAGASARLTARREAPENSRLPSQPFWCEQNFLAVPYLIARRRKEARRRTGDPSSLRKKSRLPSLPCLLPSAPRSSPSARAEERADDNPQTNELEAFQTLTCAPHCLPCSRAVRFW